MGTTEGGPALDSERRPQHNPTALLGKLGLLFVAFAITVSLLGFHNLCTLNGPRVQVATLDVRMFARAVERFARKHNRPPTILGELVPGELEQVREDPWGQPYVYRIRGKTFEVLSFGKDKKEGGGDDISSSAGDPQK